MDAEVGHLISLLAVHNIDGARAAALRRNYEGRLLQLGRGGSTSIMRSRNHSQASVSEPAFASANRTLANFPARPTAPGLAWRVPICGTVLERSGDKVRDQLHADRGNEIPAIDPHSGGRSSARSIMERNEIMETSE
jgi:hypothetical protein